jgi:hypothetical protein
MGLFDNLLLDHEHERHGGILADLAERRQRRRTLAASQAADDDGYMPPKDAATVMQMTEQQVVELAAAGFLEYRPGGRATVLIRPAVVSILAVREGAR